MNSTPFDQQPFFLLVIDPLTEIIASQKACLLKGKCISSVVEKIIFYKDKKPYDFLFSWFKIQEKVEAIKKSFAEFSKASSNESVTSEKEEELFNDFSDKVLELIRIAHLFNFIFLHLLILPVYQFDPGFFSTDIEYFRIVNDSGQFYQDSVDSIGDCKGRVIYQKKRRRLDKVFVLTEDCTRIMAVIKLIPQETINEVLINLFANIEGTEHSLTVFDLMQQVTPVFKDNLFNAGNLEFFSCEIKRYQENFLKEIRELDELEKQIQEEEEQERVSFNPC